MIKSHATYLTLVFLLSISYAASFAVGQEPMSSKSAVAEMDEHEGHDHGEEANEENHDDHDHGEDHSEEETGDAHAEHDEHGHEEEGEKAGDGHEGHGHNEAEEVGIKLDADTIREFGIDIGVAGPAIVNLDSTLPGEVQVNQDRQAHISPRYSGVAVEVRKSIGDQVKKGDVLAVIEGNESLVSYELKSLLNGTVIEKHITLGESLKEDTIVFAVADLETVWIDLTVYQKDISMIRRGQKVVVSGGEHLSASEGTISYISPTVDEHTRTSLARLVLPNPDGHWRPGMFVTGTVQLSTKEATVAVPRSAIITIEGQPSIFVMTENGFVPRTVETGVSDDDQTEILNGLEPGERYAVRNVLPLKAELNRAGLEHAGHAH